MSKYLYSDDTTPANAAQISADSGEIVHVQCPDETSARAYSDALQALLGDAEEFGSLSAELEIVGDLPDGSVRVHLCLA